MCVCVCVCVWQDVFYLTMEELFAFVDGRAVTNNLSDLAQIRKREFDAYRKVCEQHTTIHLFINPMAMGLD